MRWLALVLAAVIASACLVTIAQPARAQPSAKDEEKGRELAKEAMGHYRENEYAEAAELFEKARKVYPAAQVIRMSGYTAMALERWIEAAALLEEALKSTYKPLLPRDMEATEDELKKVMTHVGTVEVISGVSGAVLKIDDGDDIKLPHKQRMLAGDYVLKVSADNHTHVEKSITVKGGESKQYKLSPTLITDQDPEPDPVPVPDPEPEEPDEPADLFGWFPGQGIVGLAAGGLGLVAGIVGIGVGSYGVSLRGAVEDNIAAHNTNYDANCSRNRDLCLADIELINRDGARAKDFETAGLALGLAGLTLFAVGTSLYLFSDMSPLAPSDEEGKDTGLTGSCGVSLGGVGCAGSF